MLHEDWPQIRFHGLKLPHMIETWFLFLGFFPSCTFVLLIIFKSLFLFIASHFPFSSHPFFLSLSHFSSLHHFYFHAVLLSFLCLLLSFVSSLFHSLLPFFLPSFVFFPSVFLSFFLSSVLFLLFYTFLNSLFTSFVPLLGSLVLPVVPSSLDEFDLWPFMAPLEPESLKFFHSSVSSRSDSLILREWCILGRRYRLRRLRNSSEESWQSDERRLHRLPFHLVVRCFLKLFFFLLVLYFPQCLATVWKSSPWRRRAPLCNLILSWNFIDRKWHHRWIRRHFTGE